MRQEPLLEVGPYGGTVAVSGPTVPSRVRLFGVTSNCLLFLSGCIAAHEVCSGVSGSWTCKSGIALFI